MVNGNPIRATLLKWALALLGITVVSILRSPSIWHLDMWSIDEQHIVTYALSFLSGDLNPRWFIYHPLTMYVLALVYYAMYGVYWLQGWVADKVEFVALLFSDPGLFYAVARLFLSFVYTAATGLLAWVIYRCYRSAWGAGVFFALVLMMPDAVYAANRARVDGAVYLCLSVCVYALCCLEGRRRVFVLTAAAACAFAAKFPGIVLAAPLALVVGYELYRHRLTVRDLLLAVLLYGAVAVLLNPYMVLDFASYRPALDQMIGHASGTINHVGKVTHHTLLARAATVVSTLNAQSGPLVLLLAVLGSIYGIWRRQRWAVSLLFVGVYATAFWTSPYLDSYWYRPVYPFVVFFAVLSLLALPGRWAGSWAVPLRVVPLVMLLLVQVALFDAGIQQHQRQRVDPGADPRTRATTWIEHNIPAGSRIMLEGSIQAYLPNLLSTHRASSADMFDYPSLWRQPLLKEAFESYYRTSIQSHPVYQAYPFRAGKFQKYQPSIFNLVPGQYVVISSSMYARFRQAHVQQGNPLMARNANAFYDWLRTQEPVQTFAGSPRIEIWRVKPKAANQNLVYFAPF